MRSMPQSEGEQTGKLSLYRRAWPSSTGSAADRKTAAVMRTVNTRHPNLNGNGIRGVTRDSRGIPYNWMSRESAENRRLRGRGYSNFIRLIKRERGSVCENCGENGRLDVHHIYPRIDYRWLIFERDNVVLCCQLCHAAMEWGVIEPPHLRWQRFRLPRVPQKKMGGRK